VIAKYRVLYLVSALSLTLLLTFVTFVFSALNSKERSLRMIRLLSNRVGEQNDALQLTNAELGRTVSELSAREAVMSEELSLAQQIQQRFLPESYPMSGRLRFASHYDPCSKIGGDLYDAFFIDERTAGLFVADVSGHGVSAALLTAALKVAIDRHRLAIGQEFQAARTQANGGGRTRREEALAQLLHDLNAALRQIALPSQFVTILAGVIDIDSGEILLGNAGHNPPIVWRAATGAVEHPALPTNIAIGLLDQFEFKIASITAQPGDKLLFFTDGIVERRNAQDDEFGIERLLAVTRAAAAGPAESTLQAVTSALKEFSGGCEAHDDQAILIVEFLPA
jgi:sigma-B regulation protein RsbU (phosphoserine phosphatase)